MMALDLQRVLAYFQRGALMNSSEEPNGRSDNRGDREGEESLGDWPRYRRRGRLLIARNDPEEPTPPQDREAGPGPGPILSRSGLLCIFGVRTPGDDWDTEGREDEETPCVCTNRIEGGTPNTEAARGRESDQASTSAEQGREEEEEELRNRDNRQDVDQPAVDSSPAGEEKEQVVEEGRPALDRQEKSAAVSTGPADVVRSQESPLGLDEVGLSKKTTPATVRQEGESRSHSTHKKHKKIKEKGSQLHEAQGAPPKKKHRGGGGQPNQKDVAHSGRKDGPHQGKAAHPRPDGGPHRSKDQHPRLKEPQKDGKPPVEPEVRKKKEGQLQTKTTLASKAKASQDEEIRKLETQLGDASKFTRRISSSVAVTASAAVTSLKSVSMQPKLEDSKAKKKKVEGQVESSKGKGKNAEIQGRRMTFDDSFLRPEPPPKAGLKKQRSVPEEKSRKRKAESPITPAPIPKKCKSEKRVSFCEDLPKCNSKTFKKKQEERKKEKEARKAVIRREEKKIVKEERKKRRDMTKEEKKEEKEKIKQELARQREKEERKKEKETREKNKRSLQRQKEAIAKREELRAIAKRLSDKLTREKKMIENQKMDKVYRAWRLAKEKKFVPLVRGIPHPMALPVRRRPGFKENTWADPRFRFLSWKRKELRLQQFFPISPPEGPGERGPVEDLLRNLTVKVTKACRQTGVLTFPRPEKNPKPRFKNRTPFAQFSLPSNYGKIRNRNLGHKEKRNNMNKLTAGNSGRVDHEITDMQFRDQEGDAQCCIKNCFSLFMYSPDSEFGDTGHQKSAVQLRRVTVPQRMRIPKPYMRYMKFILKFQGKKGLSFRLDNLLNAESKKKPRRKAKNPKTPATSVPPGGLQYQRAYPTYYPRQRMYPPFPRGPAGFFPHSGFMPPPLPPPPPHPRLRAPPPSSSQPSTSAGGFASKIW